MRVLALTVALLVVPLSGCAFVEDVTCRDDPRGDPTGLPEGVDTSSSLGVWTARVTIDRAAEVSGSTIRTEVGVHNGAIDTYVAGDRVRVVVEAWAKGDSEEEALERLAGSIPSVEATGAAVEVDAPALRGWCQRGADVTLTVPEGVAVDGSMETSNGAIDARGLPIGTLALGTSNGGIDLADITGERLMVSTSNGAIDASRITTNAFSAETSNGRIEAELSPAGSVEAHTSNGGVDMHLRPRASTGLTVDTSNGGVTLHLSEDPEVAYAIRASTSNGGLEEDMDDAEIDREDRNDGVLRTRDGGARPIQVTGSVETSNGAITFRSL